MIIQNKLDKKMFNPKSIKQRIALEQIEIYNNILDTIVESTVNLTETATDKNMEVKKIMASYYGQCLLNYKWFGIFNYPKKVFNDETINLVKLYINTNKK